MSDAAGAARRAAQALAVFAVAPHALGGVQLRGRAGPQRDAWLRVLRALLPTDAPWCSLPAHAADEVLDGGLDLAATLSAGRPVLERGLLSRADGGVVLAMMAERMGRARAARLALALDDPARTLAVVALDEGEDEDEVVPAALRERLALQVEPAREPPAADAAAVTSARARWRGLAFDDELLQALAQAGAALGIGSARTLWHATCVARIGAALRGAAAVEPEDVGLAAQLVLAHRARQLPVPPQDAEAEAGESPPPPAGEDGDDQRQGDPDQPLPDQVVEAAQAAIPPGLLALLAGGQPRPARRGEAGRVGERAGAVQRGRPVGAKAGVPRGGARLALVETLRAAAPWQRLRGAGEGCRRVVVRRDDLRVQRREQRRGTTTIFVIDASGSQAAHRLAEAKGAVELLLADCYARRDRVAVIGFRGAGAQVLLPQTRSLVRARRQLAGLPGGGGTPLAAGIDAATAMVASVRREGSTPLVVMLTDGKANVGRGGEPGRAAAAADALAASRAFAATAAPVLVIDTSPQPGAAAAALAQALGGRCIALPYAGALAVSRAVRLQRDAGPGTAPRRPPGAAPGGARDAR